MASVQVSNEEFLTRLTELLGSASSTHSVFVNHKRVSREGSSGQWPIVVRATDGKDKASQGRIKFSTHIESSNLASFQAQYTTILRTSFSGFLKKRDKAKERRVDKLLKEKRKKMEEASKIKITAVGSNRGAGRRKRAQAKKKAMNLQKEKQRVKKASKVAAAAATTPAQTA